MPLTSLALPLAYVGATLGVVMVVPQIIRTVRHPQLPGVSALSWALVALACSAWLTYGIRTGTIPQIPGNMLLVSGAWAIVLLVPHPASRARRALVLGTATAALVTVACGLPATAGGYLAFAIGLTAVWPQLVESVQRRRSGAPSGLSLTTWSLRAISQTCWLSYAVLAVDLPVAFSAGVALSTTAFITSLEASRRMPATERELVCAPA